MHSILCVVLTEEERVVEFSALLVIENSRLCRSVSIQKLPFPSFWLCKLKSQDLCTQKIFYFFLYDKVLSVVVLHLRFLLL